MASFKLIKANEKLVRTVVGSFWKIEGTVVSSYSRIEDAFVGRYLTREGESVEQAKKRLKADLEDLK